MKNKKLIILSLILLSFAFQLFILKQDVFYSLTNVALQFVGAYFATFIYRKYQVDHHDVINDKWLLNWFVVLVVLGSSFTYVLESGYLETIQ